MKYSCAVLFSFILLSTSAHADPVNVAWDQLTDASAQSFEDPFKALSVSELSDVSSVVRLRSRLEDDGVAAEDRPRLVQRLRLKETAIEEADIDLDWLLSQRWTIADKRTAAAWAVNPELDGSDVSIKGYLLLGRDVAEGVLVAYLVPDVGMCSHIPPPPPNQLLRLELPDDVDFPDGRYTAVELTGQIAAQRTEPVVHVIDGLVAMKSAWSMSVSDLTPLSKPQAQSRRENQVWPKAVVR